ncbi:MAG: hypothetical protein Q7J42_06590 [Sulfuritalea sp.]|nr:hypothetical protein [Sulfuritalea sp.]
MKRPHLLNSLNEIPDALGTRPERFNLADVARLQGFDATAFLSTLKEV